MRLQVVWRAIADGMVTLTVCPASFMKGSASDSSTVIGCSDCMVPVGGSAGVLLRAFQRGEEVGVAGRLGRGDLQLRGR